MSTENKINTEQLYVCVGGGCWCTLSGFASCSDDHITTTYGAIHQLKCYEVTKQFQFDYNNELNNNIIIPGKYQSLLQWNTMP